MNENIPAGLKYKIENNEVEITGCDIKTNEDLIIPDTIEGYPVTSIGYRAFFNSPLATIRIPNSVEKIEKEAFFACNNLKIYIGPSVKDVGDNAFRFNGTVFISDANNNTQLNVSVEDDFSKHSGHIASESPLPYEYRNVRTHHQKKPSGLVDKGLVDNIEWKSSLPPPDWESLDL